MDQEQQPTSGSFAKVSSATSPSLKRTPSASTFIKTFPSMGAHSGSKTWHDYVSFFDKASSIYRDESDDLQESMWTKLLFQIKVRIN